MVTTPPPLPPPRPMPPTGDLAGASSVASRTGVAAALIAAAAIGICLLIAALAVSFALGSVAGRYDDAPMADRRSSAPGELPPVQNSQASGQEATNAESTSSADVDGSNGGASSASEASGSDALSEESAGKSAGSFEENASADRSGGTTGGEVSVSQEDGDPPRPDAVPLRPGEAFGIDAVGERVVYVVDCSTDLGGQGYRTATEGVAESLRTLRSNQKFAVVLFADDVYPMFFPDLREETLFPSAATRIRVENWLDEFDREALERSRAAPALEYALSLEPTDLFFVAGSAPDQETIDAITDQNGGAAIVHAVGIDVDSTDTLRNLAQRNGGIFREAP